MCPKEQRCQDRLSKLRADTSWRCWQTQEAHKGGMRWRWGKLPKCLGNVLGRGGAQGWKEQFTNPQIKATPCPALLQLGGKEKWETCL